MFRLNDDDMADFLLKLAVVGVIAASSIMYIANRNNPEKYKMNVAIEQMHIQNGDTLQYTETHRDCSNIEYEPHWITKGTK